MDNIDKARKARATKLAQGTALTPTKKAEAVRLIQSGATPTEVAHLLTLDLSQVEAVKSYMKKAQQTEQVEVSTQIRTNKASEDTQKIARLAASYLPDAIEHVGKIAREETDLSKATQALKVLHAIATSGEERTELTQTISRLRGQRKG